MKYRNTLIVVAALVVLSVLAFVLLNNNPTPPKTPDAAQNVWDYGTEQVTNVVLTQNNGKRTELLYKDNTWQVISGTQLLPGNAATIPPIITQLTKLQGTLAKDNATNLADYGLQPSRAAMTMTLQSGKTASLLIGDQVMGSQTQFYVADASKPNKVLSNADNTVATLVTWVNSPPVQPPTPTPAPPPPTPAAPITDTNTITGTGSITGTNTLTGTGSITGTGTTTGTNPITSTGSTAPATTTLTATNGITNTTVMSSTMISGTTTITP